MMSASNLLLNAYTHDEDEITLSGDEQRLIGLINRMRLFAPPDVVEGAEAALSRMLKNSRVIPGRPVRAGPGTHEHRLSD